MNIVPIAVIGGGLALLLMQRSQPVTQSNKTKPGNKRNNIVVGDYRPQQSSGGGAYFSNSTPEYGRTQYYTPSKAGYYTTKYYGNSSLPNYGNSSQPSYRPAQPLQRIVRKTYGQPVNQNPGGQLNPISIQKPVLQPFTGSSGGTAKPIQAPGPYGGGGPAYVPPYQPPYQPPYNPPPACDYYMADGTCYNYNQPPPYQPPYNPPYNPPYTPPYNPPYTPPYNPPDPYSPPAYDPFQLPNLPTQNYNQPDPYSPPAYQPYTPPAYSQPIFYANPQVENRYQNSYNYSDIQNAAYFGQNSIFAGDYFSGSYDWGQTGYYFGN